MLPRISPPQSSLCRALVEGGAGLDTAELGGSMPPLHWAAQQGRVVGIEALLKAGANLEAQDDKGMAALHWAASMGQVRAELAGASRRQEQAAGSTVWLGWRSCCEVCQDPKFALSRHLLFKDGELWEAPLRCCQQGMLRSA